MKRRIFNTVPATAVMFLLLSVTLVEPRMISPVRAEFSKLVSITGGTPAKRLSDAMVTAGYTGATALDELTLCTPSGNTNTMYLGSASSVNASTGFPLEPGTCITYRAAGRPIESSSIYLWVATTESTAVTLRQR